jgi:hypothetical protein
MIEEERKWEEKKRAGRMAEAKQMADERFKEATKSAEEGRTRWVAFNNRPYLRMSQLNSREGLDV